MGQIIPKLNLNKSPQHYETNSLVFAKNIKFGKDNNIHRDDGIEKVVSIDDFKVLQEKLQQEANDSTGVDTEKKLRTYIDKFMAVAVGLTDDNEIPTFVDELIRPDTPRDANITKQVSLLFDETDNDFEGKVLQNTYSYEPNKDNYAYLFSSDSKYPYGEGSALVPFIAEYKSDSNNKDTTTIGLHDDINNVDVYQRQRTHETLTLLYNEMFNAKILTEKLQVGTFLSPFLIPILNNQKFNYLFGFADYIRSCFGYDKYYDTMNNFNAVFDRYMNIVNIITDSTYKVETNNSYFKPTNANGIYYKDLTVDLVGIYTTSKNWYIEEIDSDSKTKTNAGTNVSGIVYYYPFIPMLIQLKWFCNYATNVVSFITNNYSDLIAAYNATITETKSTYYLDIVNNIVSNTGSWLLAKCIPYNTSFYMLLYNIGNNTSDLPTSSIIIKYDEKYPDNKLSVCDTNWHMENYDKDIIGYATLNLRGDTILTIAEKPDEIDEEKFKIPLKNINLSYSSYTDDESIYTQAPAIPIMNLQYANTYLQDIPAGTYQFFVRYKINEYDYTNWMPCSKELFAGRKETIEYSVVGTIDYIDTNNNSNKSFTFIPNIIYNTTNYDTFQLGFILAKASDNTIVCRAWKEFPIYTSKINFTYNETDISEVDIDDMLENIFQLYNVGNLTFYKNKQYISNYQETNFNANLQNYANNINISLAHNSYSNTYYFKRDGEYPAYFRYVSITQAGVGTSIREITRSLIEDYRDAIITELKKEEPFSDGLFKYATNKLGVQMNVKYGSYTLITPNDIAYSNYTATFVRNRYNTLVEKNTTEKVSNDIICILEPSEIPNASGWVTYRNNYFYYSATKDCWWDVINKGSEQYAYIKLRKNVDDDGVRFLLYQYGYVQDAYNVFVNEMTPQIYNVEELSRRGFKSVPLTLYIIRKDGNYYHFYNTTVSFSLLVNPNNISPTDITQVNTLLPMQGYKFYVHYVTTRGEITNGYFVKEITGPNGNSTDVVNHNVIYPVFSNIILPPGYVACFFSIYHYKHTVYELFATKYSTSNDGTVRSGWSTNKYYDCAEIDCGISLFSEGYVTTAISEFSGMYDHKATYYSANNTNSVSTYGNVGKVVLEDNLGDDNSKFIIKAYEDTYDNPVLIKCTEYITASNYDAYSQMNLGGYLCSITKVFLPESHYISGEKEYTLTTDANNRVIKTNHSTKLTQLRKTYANIIYSNYNLNFISLSDQTSLLTQLIDISDDGKGTDNSVTSMIITYFNSGMLSKIYTLKSGYYDYTRKTFGVVKDTYTYKYDNTIRASILNGDEDIVIRYKYDADEYYNIPTNKGKITNLVTISDNILVHTEDSLFRFNGSNKLSGQESEINLSESNLFDIGISEVFGSEHGFGGLQDRRWSLLAHNAYYYWDSDSNNIYRYDGNGTPKVISDLIYKLLYDFKIDSIIFSEDFYNNRIFVQLKNYSNNAITLSYFESANSFVSIHDFKYENSFNTKVNCYFYNNNFDGNFIYKVDENTIGYNNLKYAPALFPNYKLNDEYCAIVDVIIMSNFNDIKVLDSINWICSNISTYNESNSNITISTRLAEELLDRDYAGDYLLIYSDSCSTELIDIQNRANDVSITTANKRNPNIDSYKRPRYNLGTWSLNYFRNILNTNDVFKYGLSSNNSDNKSLMYGKYFVARFVFDSNNNFKLENVTLNINNYV